jgi:hypothetical protein
VHAWVLQACDSDPDPTQAAPPLAGAGLLQRRVRVRVPPPQVRLQVPNEAHAPQFPLTLIFNQLKIFILFEIQ